MLCCPAAVPSDVIRNSTSMPGISLAAFSVPLRAIVQKSEALLVTNASLCLPPVVLVPPPPPPDFPLHARKKNVQKSAQRIAGTTRRLVDGCIGVPRS